LFPFISRFTYFSYFIHFKVTTGYKKNIRPSFSWLYGNWILCYLWKISSAVLIPGHTEQLSGGQPA